MTLLGLAAAVVAAGAPFGARAADIKVLTAGAFKRVVLALVPEFEEQTGNKVVVENDTVGALTKRIEGGEAFDLAVLTPAAVNDLSGKGKLVAGSRTNLGRVGVGVVVKEGTPKPDISSVEAFKKALLGAKSIAYVDPATGATTGIHLAKVMENLGIANELKPKTKLVSAAPGQGSPRAGEAIVRGEAEIAMQPISELKEVDGIEVVGPLPAELQSPDTVYVAASPMISEQPIAAKALIDFLASPDAKAVYKAKGMEPG